jgi:hypothetical protein
VTTRGGAEGAAGRFSPLTVSESGSPSPLATEVALIAGRRSLIACFRSAYGVLTPEGVRHDDDLYAGDVVELFVAPDARDRRIYFEIEVNPEGLVFDARVTSPDLDRRTMQVDRSWNPRGLRVRSRLLPAGRSASSPQGEPHAGAGCAGGGEAHRRGNGAEARADPPLDAPGLWLVRIALDWSELRDDGLRPRELAIGATRIDRRSTGAPLYLSLFPNLARPANFHTPASFGLWIPHRASPPEADRHRF